MAEEQTNNYENNTSDNYYGSTNVSNDKIKNLQSAKKLNPNAYDPSIVGPVYKTQLPGVSLQEKEALDIQKDIETPKYTVDKIVQYLPHGNMSDPNFNTTASVLGINRILELSHKHNVGFDNDETLESWKTNLSSSDEDVKKNLEQYNSNIGNNPQHIGEMRQMVSLYDALPEEKRNTLKRYWNWQKSGQPDPYAERYAYTRKPKPQPQAPAQSQPLNAQNSVPAVATVQSAPSTQPTPGANQAKLASWDIEPTLPKTKPAPLPSFSQEQVAKISKTREQNWNKMLDRPEIRDEQSNYTNTAKKYQSKFYEFDSKGKGVPKKPFDIDAENNVTIKSPEVKLRNTEADFLNMLVEDLFERQKQGFFKEAKATDIFSGKYFNRVTGEFIDDGSETANYLKNMEAQMPSLINKFRSEYALYLSATNDSNNHTFGADQEKVWKRNLSELKDNNVFQGIVRGALGTAASLSTALQKMLTPNSWAEKRAKELGYNNAEEAWSADKQNALAFWEKLAKDIPKENQFAVNESKNKIDSRKYLNDYAYNNFVNDFHKGYLSLTKNGELDSDLMAKLQQAAPDGKTIEKIADAKTLFSEMLNQGYVLSGDLAAGGLGSSFKASGGALNAIKTIRAENKLVALGKKLGQSVLRNARTKELQISKELEAAAMASDEAKKTIALFRSINKVGTAEQVSRDAIAFGMNAVMNDENQEQIAQQFATGAVFGFVNNVLGNMFGDLVARNAAKYMKLESNLAKTHVTPYYEHARTIGTALSNLVANPASNIVAGMMVEEVFNVKMPTDEALRRQAIIDVIMGGIFGVNDILTHRNHIDTRHARELFNAYKEFDAEKTRLVESNNATFADMTNAVSDLEDKARKAAQDAEQRQNKSKVTVDINLGQAKEDVINLDDDARDEYVANVVSSSTVKEPNAAEQQAVAETEPIIAGDTPPIEQSVASEIMPTLNGVRANYYGKSGVIELQDGIPYFRYSDTRRAEIIESGLSSSTLSDIGITFGPSAKKKPVVVPDIIGISLQENQLLVDGKLYEFVKINYSKNGSPVSIEVVENGKTKTIRRKDVVQQVYSQKSAQELATSGLQTQPITNGTPTVTTQGMMLDQYFGNILDQHLNEKADESGKILYEPKSDYSVKEIIDFIENNIPEGVETLPLLKGMTMFMKNLPEGVKISRAKNLEITIAGKDGQTVKTKDTRPMYYSPSDNTIYINDDYAAHGNHTAMANTLSQEMVHAITVNKMRDPKVVEQVESIRQEVIENWKNGKYDNYLIRDYRGFEISVGEFPELMEYYLGSPEEFVAGIYDGNTPLWQIVSNEKLKAQRSNKIADAVTDILGKKSPTFKDAVHSFVGNIQSNPYIVNKTSYGAFPVDLYANNVLKQIQKIVEGDVLSSIEDSKLEDVVGKMSSGEVAKAYGAENYPQVRREWQRTLAKDGPYALIESVKQRVDEHTAKLGIASDVHRIATRQRAINLAKSYILNHGNDGEHVVLAIQNNTGDKGVKISRVASSKEREQKVEGMSRDDYNFDITKNGDGKEFSFKSKVMGYGNNLMQSLANRLEKSTHVSADARTLIGSLTNLKKADLQYYSNTSEETNEITTQLKLNPRDFSRGVDISKEQFQNMSIEALKQSKIFIFPRVDSFAAVDVSPLLNMIKDFGDRPNPFGKYTTAEVVNHLYNAFATHWLKSYQGGNAPELAKHGNIVDVGKLFALDPAQFDSFRSEKELYDAILRDDSSINDKNRQAMYDRAKETGLTVEVAKNMRNKLRPIMQDVYTGDNIPWGQKAILEYGPEKALHKAIDLTLASIKDPALKSFGRTETITSYGTRKIKASKMDEKYGSITRGSSVDYSQIKDADHLRAIIGNKYDRFFDGDNNPIQSEWDEYGIKWDKRGGSWNAYEKVLRLDSGTIESMADEFPWAAQLFNEKNTDGATFFINNKTAELYGDIIGKRDITTFKNASVVADKDHAMINKTAYHLLPKHEGDMADYLPEGMKDKAVEYYNEQQRFMDALKAQGITKIVMTTALKSGGTFALKESMLSTATMTDVPVLYDHFGLVQKMGGESDANVNDVNKDIYRLILNGGNVPAHTTYEQPLLGVEQGQSFITSASNIKQTERAYTQQLMPGLNAKNSIFAATHLPLMERLIANNEKRAQNAFVINNMIGDVLVGTPRAFSYKEKRMLGSFMQRMHERLGTAFDSDDMVTNTNISESTLRMAAQSYRSSNGEHIINDFAFKAFIEMNYDLFEPGGIYQHLIESEYDAYKHMHVFGAGLKLMPLSNPAQNFARMIANETNKEIEKYGSKEAAADAIADIANFANKLATEHFDTDGNVKENSLGVFIGEQSIAELNAIGRNRYGNNHKELSFGYLGLLDLKPADNIDSNSPIVILGTFPGRGMMLPPKRAAHHGRDFDNDDMGIVCQSPEWESDGSTNFLNLVNTMVDQNLPYRTDIRTVESLSRPGMMLTQKDLGNGLAEFIGKQSVTAMHLKAKTDLTDMHPMSIGYYGKQASASMMGLGIGATNRLSINLGTDIPLKNNKVFASTGAERQIPLVSYYKQMHDVDLYNPNPVNSESVLNNIYSDKENSLYELFRIENGDRVFRNIQKNPEPAIYDTDFNPIRAKELSKKLSYGNNISPELKEQFLTNKIYSEIANSQTLSISKDKFDKIDEGIATQLLGRSLLKGMPYNKNKAALIIENANGLVYADTKYSTFGFRFKPVGRPEERYTVNELFNIDGSLKPVAQDVMQRLGVTAKDLAPKDANRKYVVDEIMTNGTTREVVLGEFSDMREVHRNDLKGRLIAQIASKAEGDPRLAATEILLAKIGNGEVPVKAIKSIIEGMRAEGIDPVSSIQEDRKFAEVYVYNTDKDSWVPVEKIGKSYVPVDTTPTKPEGELVSERTQERVLAEGKDQKTVDKSTVITEEMTYRQNTPLEMALFGILKDEYRKQAMDNQKQFGAFDVNAFSNRFWTVQPSKILADAEKQAGMDNVYSHKNTPEQYEKLMGFIRAGVEKEYGNIPPEQLDAHFKKLMPNAEELLSTAKAFGASGSRNAMADFMYQHLWSSINGLRELNKVYARAGYTNIDPNKPWLIDKKNAVARFALMGNSWQSNHAAGLIAMTADRRMPKSASDVYGQRTVYKNGQAESTHDMYYGDRYWGMEPFRGTQSVPEVFERFLSRIDFSSQVKGRGEVELERFAQQNGTIRQIYQGEDSAPIDVVQHIYNRGYLDGIVDGKEMPLPEVNVTAVSKNTSSADSNSVTVSINGSTDIKSELQIHYEKLGVDAAELDNVVEAITHLINGKAAAALHANDVLSIADEHYNMIVNKNADLLNGDMRDVYDRAVFAQTEGRADAERLTNMSLKDVFHDMAYVPEVLARNTLLGLVTSKKGTGYNFWELFQNDIPADLRENNTAYQNKLLYDIGRELLKDSNGQYTWPEFSFNTQVMDRVQNARLSLAKQIVRNQINRLSDAPEQKDLMLTKDFLTKQDEISFIDEEELLALRSVNTSKIIEALKNVVSSKIDPNAQYSDITRQSIEQIPFFETSASEFATRKKNRLHKALREQSLDALNLYHSGLDVNGTSIRDTNELANNQAAWLMSNGYGQMLNFIEEISPEDHLHGITANMPDNGILTSHPMIDAGQQCVVVYNDAKNETGRMMGRYVGSFSPKLYEKSSDPNDFTAKYVGLYEKPYSVFYNEKQGTVFVVPSENITFIGANRDSGWSSRIDGKIGKELTNAEAFLSHLQENSQFVYADIPVNADGDYWEAIGQEPPATERKMLQATINSEDLKNFVGTTRGIRDISLVTSIEKSIYDGLSSAQAKTLYKGGKDAMKFAVYGAAMVASGASHMMGLNTLSSAGDIALTGASVAIASLAMRYIRNFASNRSTGSRVMPMFINKNPIGTRLKYLYKNVAKTSVFDANTQNVSVAEARQINKLLENTPFANVMENVGIEDNSNNRMQIIKNALFMLRAEQQLNAHLDKYYSEFKPTIDQMIKGMAYETWQDKQAANAFLMDNRWRKYLETINPKLLKDLAKRGLVPILSSDKKTIDWTATDEGKLAEAYLQSLGGLTHKFLMFNAAKLQSGGAALKSIGYGIEKAYLAKQYISTAKDKIFKTTVADTEAFGAGDALKNAKDIVQNIREFQYKNGIEPMNNEMAEELRNHVAVLATGSSEKNEFTARNMLGRLTRLFAIFNGKHNEKIVSNYASEKDHYNFVYSRVSEDPMFMKYIEKGFGIHLGKSVVFDPKKQRLRSAATTILEISAKMAISAAITYMIASALGDDDEEQGATLSNVQKMKKYKYDYKPLFNDDINRMLSDHDFFANFASDATTIILNEAKFSKMDVVNQARTKNDKIVVGAASPKHIVNSEEEKLYDMKALPRNVNQGPIISTPLGLIASSLSYMYLLYKGKEGYIADMMKDSEVKSSSGRATQKKNIGIAYDYMVETQPYKMAAEVLNATYSPAGTLVELYNSFFNDKEQKLEEMGKKKKSKQ